jgi:hemoglobin-like flavoprotein
VIEKFVADRRRRPSSAIMSISIIRWSFDRILAAEPALVGHFYDLLFARHPEVQPLFTRHARAAQERMLAEALVALVDHLDDAAWLRETLPPLGARHARYGVSDEMYGWVGACLLEAMAAAAGEEWTPEVAAAWTGAYQAVAGLMQEGAHRAAAPRPLERGALAAVSGGSDSEWKYVPVRK